MPVSVTSDDHARPRALPRLVLALAVSCLCALAFAQSASAAVPRSFFAVSAVRPTPADFHRMAELGVGTYRVEISWPAVQRTEGGGYNWAETDRRFRRASTFGLRVAPIIFGSPEWVTGDGKHIRGPVKDKQQRNAWKRFASAALQRYGPDGVFWRTSRLNGNLAPRNWIVWNEQNARAFWHPQASPKQYGQLLRITRQAFDGVDPSVKMTVGGMYGFPIHDKAMNAKPYLKRLYRQRGVKQAIDGVSVHPYSGNVKGAKKQTRVIRRVMNKAGDRRASIYIGETGWASAGPKTGAFDFMVKNKKRQAKLLKRVYKMFLNKRKAWRIRGVVWFTWRDYDGDEICNWCPKAGLLNKRSKIKPSGLAMQRLIAKKIG